MSDQLTPVNARAFFVLSVLLSLGTVHFYPGAADDAIFTAYAVRSMTLPGHLYGHTWGFAALVRFLHAFLGLHYDAYRLIFLSIGLTAFSILAYVVRRSPLAILALAGLLWMPDPYALFRQIRYDSIHLLIIAVNILWLVDRPGPVFGFLAGLAAGLIPMISLPGILILPACAATVAWSWNQRRLIENIAWLLGAGIGGSLFLLVYPLHPWFQELTAYHQAHGWHMGQPMGFHLLLHPIMALAKFTGAFGVDCGGSVLFNSLLYGLLFLMVVQTAWTRMLSRFALCFAISHFLFSESRYPILVDSIFVIGGVSAADEAFPNSGTRRSLVLAALLLSYLAGYVQTAKLMYTPLHSQEARLLFSRADSLSLKRALH